MTQEQFIKLAAIAERRGQALCIEGTSSRLCYSLSHWIEDSQGRPSVLLTWKLWH